MVKLVNKIFNKKSIIPSLNSNYVVFIHADWCGHCKDFMPEWKKVIDADIFTEDQQNELVLASIEEKQYDDDMKKKFGEVNGYPTIRFISSSSDGKEKEDFQNERNADNVLIWIQSILKKQNKKHKHNQKHKHQHGGRSVKKSLRQRRRRHRRNVKKSLRHRQ